MKITPIGQSGYIINTAKTQIIIDPYLSDSVLRASGKARMLPLPIEPSEIHCDAVICTHDHLDHLDPDTVTEIDENQFYITTYEGVKHLSQLGRKNAKAVSEGDRISVGDLVLNIVFADHTVEAFGVVAEAEGKRLYFSGDTLYNEKLFEISKFKPDYTFICINGRLGNMNVTEALRTAKEIGADVNIPNHYDMFASNSENPHLFADVIEGGRILEFNTEYEI